MAFITAEQYDTSPHGRACTFVRVGAYGMKIFRCESDRDGSLVMQCELHDIGFAPFAHFPFEFDLPNGKRAYAFWTDVVHTCGEEMARLPEEPQYDATNPDVAAFRQWKKLTSPIFDKWDDWACELRRTLLRAGYDWVDDHCWNVGITTDGTLVCVDCEPAFFERRDLTPA